MNILQEEKKSNPERRHEKKHEIVSQQFIKHIVSQNTDYSCIYNGKMSSYLECVKSRWKQKMRK